MKTLEIYFVALICLVASACTPEPTTQIPPKAPKSQKIKNLIIAIGDGMGPQQLGLLSTYCALILSKEGESCAIPAMLDSGVSGVVMTDPAHFLVADSACAATSIATGAECVPGTLGISDQGVPVETIMHKGKKRGMSTGIISDTRITHATPAGFAVGARSRYWEDAIAGVLIQSGVDILMGGGAKHFIPKDPTEPIDQALLDRLEKAKISAQKTRADQVNLLSSAQSSGYELAFTKEELAKLDSSSAKILGLFSSSQMASGFQAGPDQMNQPSLAEMTQFALDKLAQNPKGFVLMVEAGQIDWAGHDNDVGWLLKELLKFDQTLKTIKQWANARQDTAVVITADHETGGFGLSYHTDHNPQILELPGKIFEEIPYKPVMNFLPHSILKTIADQKESFSSMLQRFISLPSEKRNETSLIRFVKELTSLDLTEVQAKQLIADFKRPNAMQGSDSICMHDTFYPQQIDAASARLALALAPKTGITWGTGTHTSTPVIATALGPKNKIQDFAGIYRLSELGKKLENLIMADK